MTFAVACSVSGAPILRDQPVYAALIQESEFLDHNQHVAGGVARRPWIPRTYAFRAVYDGHGGVTVPEAGAEPWVRLLREETGHHHLTAEAVLYRIARSDITIGGVDKGIVPCRLGLAVFDSDVYRRITSPSMSPWPIVSTTDLVFQHHRAALGLGTDVQEDVYGLFRVLSVMHYLGLRLEPVKALTNDQVSRHAEARQCVDEATRVKR